MVQISVVLNRNFQHFIFTMDQNEDGNAWKFGLSFICLGIVGVVSMGVFSLIHYGGKRGK